MAAFRQRKSCGKLFVKNSRIIIADRIKKIQHEKEKSTGMKKNLKKVMAYMLLTSVCFGQVVPGIDVKAEEKESGETSYIVTVKSDRAYEQLSEEYQLQIDDTVSPELS